MKRIYVIGGSNIDIYAKSVNELVLKDSNISDISFAFGGVGRNIAENLANLKANVSFVTALGGDSFGKDILSSLIGKGVSMTNSIIINDATTSSYMAVLNKDDMYVGMCDTSVLDKYLTTKHIDDLKDKVDDEDFVIFETNLSEEIIKYILNNLKGTKITDAISTNKVVRLNKVLDKLDILKLNKLEAQKLSGIEIKSDEDIKKISKFLHEKGVKEILITDGAKAYISKDNIIKKYEHHAYNENPVNVTGAGDSLIAAYSFKRFEGSNTFDSISFAMSLAVLTVGDKNAVGNFSVEDVMKNREQIRVEESEI